MTWHEIHDIYMSFAYITVTKVNRNQMNNSLGGIDFSMLTLVIISHMMNVGSW